MSVLNQDTLSVRDAELQSALGARVADGNEAAQAQVSYVCSIKMSLFPDVILQSDLESLKVECAGLREEAVAATLGRDLIKSEYDTYKKRVNSVLAEQDSQYNRVIELERLLHASAAASDAKSRELHRALAHISEMEAIAAQVPHKVTHSCQISLVGAQETNALHSLRQQLADATNARDVARVREQASEAKAAALESRRAALEAASSEAAATAASEIQSLQAALHLVQQEHKELQRSLQLKEAESNETLRTAAAEIANLSAKMLDLQQAHRCSHKFCIGVFDGDVLCSAALIQLEKLKGDNSCSTISSSAEIISPTEHRTFDAHSVSIAASSMARQRYPQLSLENLLSEPPSTSFKSSVRAHSAHVQASSEADSLQLHVAALEMQVATLRDALRDAQDQCSFFEKQCNWFKKKELEMQLSQDRNSSASDLDYLRRLVAAEIAFEHTLN